MVKNYVRKNRVALAPSRSNPPSMLMADSAASCRSLLLAVLLQFVPILFQPCHDLAGVAVELTSIFALINFTRISDVRDGKVLVVTEVNIIVIGTVGAHGSQSERGSQGYFTRIRDIFR